MIKQEQLDYLKKLLFECQGLVGSNSRLMQGEEGVYGIEFENYQTLKITIKPTFDMPDPEVDALMNLFAHGLPMLGELIDECERLEYLRLALLEAIRAIAVAGRDDVKSIRSVIVEREEDSNLTVGEK